MQRTRILVPLSFSTPSDYALLEARLLSGQMNGMLTCLHVIEEPSYLKSHTSREIGKKIRREAEIRLSENVNRIIPGSDNIVFEIIVTAGIPYRKILEKAAELNPGLIVMGRADEVDSGNQRLGSNTLGVLTGSTIPVLITPVDSSGAQMSLHRSLDLNGIQKQVRQTSPPRDYFGRTMIS